MYNKPLKVAAIHDLSGVGRCSLSVILPTLSVQGIQVCSVPTAVLSAHTNGFGDVVMHDLTDYITLALNHYNKLNYEFDCIYSGFLASAEQIDHCLSFFNSYKNALKVVDPVMADNGKPYRTCTEKLCNGMKTLVKIADIITPNLTEASILLNENLATFELSSQEMKSYLVRLSKLGPKIVVITGVLSDGKAYNIGYESETSKFWRVPFKRINASYPGTGDVFASVLTGSILRGDSLPIAINRATEFLEIAIKTTHSYSTDSHEGIMLESCLGLLISNQILSDYEQF